VRKGKEVRKDETMDNSNGIYAAQADRAYCVDAIDFMRMLPDKSIDLIIADPPYYRINGFFDFQFDSEEDYLLWCMEWVEQCFRILKDSGAFYCWCSCLMLDKLSVHVLDQFKWDKRNLIVWNYKTGRAGKRAYRQESEFCWFYSKQNHLLNVDAIRIPYTSFGFEKDKRKNPAGKTCGNVWESPRIMPNFKEYAGHPTQKPLMLCERIVRASSQVGDMVMVPFAGSGSEVVACIRLGRLFFATENCETYYHDILSPRLDMARLVSVEGEQRHGK